MLEKKVLLSFGVIMSCATAFFFIFFEWGLLTEFAVVHSIPHCRAIVNSIAVFTFVPAVIFFICGLSYMAYEKIKYNEYEKSATIKSTAAVCLVFLTLTCFLHQSWHNKLSTENFDFKEINEFEVKPIVNKPNSKLLVFVHEGTPYEVEVDNAMAGRRKVYLAFYRTSGDIFGLVAEKN